MQNVDVCDVESCKQLLVIQLCLMSSYSLTQACFINLGLVLSLCALNLQKSNILTYLKSRFQTTRSWCQNVELEMVR